MSLVNSDNTKVIDSLDTVVAFNMFSPLFSSSTLIKLSKRSRNSNQDLVQIIKEEDSPIVFFRVLNKKLRHVDVIDFFFKNLKEVLCEMKKTLTQFSEYLPEPFTKSEMYEIHHYDEEKHEIKCEFLDPVPYLIARNENLSNKVQPLKLVTSLYGKKLTPQAEIVATSGCRRDGASTDRSRSYYD